MVLSPGGVVAKDNSVPVGCQFPSLSSSGNHKRECLFHDLRMPKSRRLVQGGVRKEGEVHSALFLASWRLGVKTSLD